MTARTAALLLASLASCSQVIGVEDTETGVRVRVLAVAPGIEAGDIYSGDQRVGTVAYGQMSETLLVAAGRPLAIRAAGAPADTAPLVERPLVNGGPELRTAVWSAAAGGGDHQLVELADAPVGQLRLSHMIPGLEDLEVGAAGGTFEISQLGGAVVATSLADDSLITVATNNDTPVGNFAIDAVAQPDGPLHLVIAGDPAQRLPFPEALSVFVIDRSGVVQTALTEPVIYALGAIPDSTQATLSFDFEVASDRTVMFGHAQLERLTVAPATTANIRVDVDAIGFDFGAGIEIERGRDYLFVVAGSATASAFAFITQDGLEREIESAVLGLGNALIAPNEPLAAELASGGTTVDIPEWDALNRGTLVTAVDVDAGTFDLVVDQTGSELTQFPDLPFAPGDRSYGFISGEASLGFELLIVDTHTIPWSLRVGAGQ